MLRFEERGLAGRARTILVVEDNDLNREMLCVLLEEEYQIIQAANGKDGLELLQACYENISLVLLDIVMPVLDGFEFLRICRADERFSDIPIIVTTASQSSDAELECLRLGANDFVRKPYNHDIILNRVNNIIMLRESASIVNQMRWDPITGLNRKEFFQQRVESLLEAYPDKSFDLMCSDVRNFKMLNERYGREHCDKMLHDLASRLSAVIPGLLARGRVDGDIFGFLYEHPENDWTEALSSAVEEMETPHLYVRFGIVEDVDHAAPAVQLCDYARTALGQLKDSVGAGIARYDDDLRKHLEFEQLIVESMATGLEEHQFLAYYQPKHSVNTGKVAGAEALVRWQHPELGFVRPDMFISVFERNGMIAQLDRFVCEEACAEIARLQKAGLPVVPVSVNMSPLDFDDPDLPLRILEIADRYGIDHSLLHLELTETAYAEDPDIVVNALSELRSYGFKIELDDFGSGYSSLALLNTLPLDILKIDGTMVRNAAKFDDFRIIKTCIQIAQVLDLEIVVEGVETAETVDRLRYLGCDMIQGYFFSMPLKQEDFEEYLQAH